VRVHDWSRPDPEEKPTIAELRGTELDAFFVPAGYANSLNCLEPGSQALVLSSANLQQSLLDDYRIHESFWQTP